MKNLEGRMIIKTGFENKPVTSVSIMEEADKLLDVEQYLNRRVSTEVYKKWGVAIRFHILEKKTK